jgi:hypothetical protein
VTCAFEDGWELSESLVLSSVFRRLLRPLLLVPPPLCFAAVGLVTARFPADLLEPGPVGGGGDGSG